MSSKVALNSLWGQGRHTPTLGAQRSLGETETSQDLHMVAGFQTRWSEDLLLKKEEVCLKLKQINIVDLGPDSAPV